MSTSQPDDAEKDFIDAIAMCGKIAAIFNKHRATHGLRIDSMRQMILATTPQDVVARFYLTHIALKETNDKAAD